MIEIVFLLIGTAFGFVFGLLPGIHPNTIIVFVPLLAALNLEPLSLVSLIVGLGVSNAFADFIPSILLSAPDSESGLATLPGQRLLAQGKGLLAIKLAVMGGVFSVALCALLVPLLALCVPTLYAASRGWIWVVLVAFVVLMITTERARHKIFWASVCFLLAGITGIATFGLAIDRALILFPVFTGLFAFPHLLLQIRGDVQMPAQSRASEETKLRTMAKPASLGTLGGILSGFLPGIGSAEIASVLTVDKNDKSFLTTMGALATSNIVISFLAIWLIGNPRSGIAVALDQLTTIDMRLFLSMVFTTLLAAAIAAPLTLFAADRLLERLQKMNYVLVSKTIFLFLVAMVALSTGPLGVLVSLTCCGLGLFVNFMQIKRGILMGVLIIPTLLFLIGV